MVNIPLDKKAHAWAGMSIMLSLSLFFPVIWAFAISIIVGIGKEMYDKWSGNGTFDMYDAYATWAGTLVASVLILISM